MHYPLKIWLLLAGNGLIELLRTMVLPFLAIYLRIGIHLDAVTVGMVVGLSALSNLASGFLLGPLSDRMGRRTALVASSILTVVSLVGFALVRTVWGFAGLEVLSGAAFGIESPAFQSLLADLAPPSARLRLYGTAYWIRNMGAGIGPLVGALAGAGHFAAPFLYAGLGSLVLVGGALLVPRGRVPDAPPPEGLGSPRHLMQIVGRPIVWGFLLGEALVALSYAQIETNVSQVVALAAPDGTRIFALMMACNAALVICLQPLAARWQRARAPRRGAVAGAALYSGASLLFLVAPPGENWILVMGVFTAGEVLLSPLMAWVTAVLAPDSERASYFAVATAVSGLAWTVGPVLGGAALAWGGRWALFLGMAVVNGLALAAFARAMSHDARFRTARGAALDLEP